MTEKTHDKELDAPLKRAVMNVGWVLVFVGVVSLLFLAAAGFLLAGIYQYLAAQMSSAAASVLVLLLALVFTLSFAGLAKWWTADPE